MAIKNRKRIKQFRMVVTEQEDVAALSTDIEDVDIKFKWSAYKSNLRKVCIEGFYFKLANSDVWIKDFNEHIHPSIGGQVQLVCVSRSEGNLIVSKPDDTAWSTFTPKFEVFLKERLGPIYRIRANVCGIFEPTDGHVRWIVIYAWGFRVHPFIQNESGVYEAVLYDKQRKVVTIYANLKKKEDLGGTILEGDNLSMYYERNTLIGELVDNERGLCIPFNTAWIVTS